MTTDGLRAKLSARLDDGLIRLTIEWVEVVDNQVGPVRFKEEVKIGPERAGCAYLSRVVLGECQVTPGTFWLDEAGRRHFIMQADPDTVSLLGGPIGAVVQGG